MKLIIDIPDMIYNILNGDSSWKGLSVDYILNAIKDGTPLEAQPNRCDSCKHSEERDGSNCYECVKGMSDNFEAQPTDTVNGTRRIVDVDELLKYMKDTRTYDIVWALQYAPIIQTCKDCISRDDLNDAISELTYWHYEDGRLVVGGDGNNTVYKVNDVAKLVHVLPPIQPQTCEDAVSREMVEEITFQEPSYTDPYNILTEIREKVRALKPVTLQQSCEDCVSREAVLELAKKGILVSNDNYKCVVNAIKSLPPVTPQRPKGKWIMNSDYPDRLICDKCNAQFDVWHWESKQMHFCPNCGAKMEVDI